MLDQMQSFIFGPGSNTASSPMMTMEELKRRRDIATALASRNRPYAKNVGEGIASLGESIGDVLAHRSLTAAERAYGAQRANDPLFAPPGTSAAPPVTAPRADAVAPRDSLANTIASTAPGVPQPNPTLPGEASPPTSPAPISPAGSPAPEDVWQARSNAISGIETGTRKDAYTARGPVIPKTGDRAHGKYQVMGANIGPWTREALGQELTPAQFLASKDAQEAVFRHRFGNYVARYGEEGAARAWFAGEKGMDNSSATDPLGRITVGEYGRNYLSRLRRGAPTAAVNPTGTVSDAPPIGMPVEENPETPSEIAPAPVQIAQAGNVINTAPRPDSAPAPARPRMGTVPGPLDPRAPEPTGPTQTGPAVPGQFLQAPVKPIAPQRQDTLSPEEWRGWQIMKKYPLDQEAQKQGERLIQFGAARREAEYARRVEEYKQEFGRYEKSALAWEEYQRQRPQKEFEFAEAQKKAAREERERAQFPLGKDQAIKIAEESAKKVENIPASMMSIANVRQALPTMFTGSTAEMALSMAKLRSAFGMPTDPRIEPTESFRSFITAQLAQLRAAVVGAGPQSEKELATLQQAAGSDIKLERGSIERVLNSIERLNEMAATQHHKKLLTIAGNDANVRQQVFGIYELPMERIVPRGTVEFLKKEIAKDPDNPGHVEREMEEFNRNYHTPGLAQKVLGR